MPTAEFPLKKSFLPKLRQQTPHKAGRTSILSRKNFLSDAALTALVGVCSEKQHEYFFCIAHLCTHNKRCGEMHTCSSRACGWQNIVRHLKPCFLWENLRHEVARHKSRLCNWARGSVKRAGKNIPTAGTGNEVQTVTEKIKVPFSTKKRQCAEKTGEKRQKYCKARVKFCQIDVKAATTPCKVLSNWCKARVQSV